MTAHWKHCRAMSSATRLDNTDHRSMMKAVLSSLDLTYGWHGYRAVWNELQT
ncbi:hypothetical protein POSPLADRAFT_1044114 [Postia placenta MAD-698-R-SB12]|uniref:Uncharacterized protein n=1 Tax=Postia placenta MAD-698-R-SB12 TaxID=670580 RepID=A0A1X6N7Y0_9APHY|nr:hypothetical protein POSPLADRAFT_1044114 [Postia placenta MAD-698-R-SB12]OSX64600.1 hypothetical protein POSPLADRAFT_1044114 [Postia placenta MAD-698-R-SB12]